MSETYEPYEPPVESSGDGEQWCVIDQYAGEAGLEVIRGVHGSRGEAMAEAARQAFEWGWGCRNPRVPGDSCTSRPKYRLRRAGVN